MRIAFFVWEYPPMLVGGLGTYAEYITREYIKNGNDVSVFTINPGNLPTREVIQGVEVHRPLLVDIANVFPLFFTQDITSWGPQIKFFNDILIYNILSTAKFINLVEKSEGKTHDVVAFHDWLSAISGITIKNMMKNKPVVFHVHSTEWGSTGDGLQSVKHLELEAAKHADWIITVSHAMKEDLERHGWPSDKISVVWNGVDPEKYDPSKVPQEKVEELRRRYGIEDDEIMILFIGRLTWVKGVVNLIQAMPDVISQYPKAKLVILGRGEQQNSIMELSERLGISKNLIVRFEFVPEEERILHYAACDLAVFPSVYEPFGIVSLEAMSMGKPVVVGANGVVGFREQVIPSGPEQNGVHINGNDPRDIAWGIKVALEDPKRMKEWGKNGRNRVLKYFTWQAAARQTLEVYQNVISKSKKS